MFCFRFLYSCNPSIFSLKWLHENKPVISSWPCNNSGTYSTALLFRMDYLYGGAGGKLSLGVQAGNQKTHDMPTIADQKYIQGNTFSASPIEVPAYSTRSWTQLIPKHPQQTSCMSLWYDRGVVPPANTVDLVGNLLCLPRSVEWKRRIRTHTGTTPDSAWDTRWSNYPSPRGKVKVLANVLLHTQGTPLYPFTPFTTIPCQAS